MNKQQKRPNENDDEDEGEGQRTSGIVIFWDIYMNKFQIYKKEVVIEIEIEICVENILKREGN